ncbi:MULTISPECIES: hypothetical protein [Actinomadura]|uniref:hypothetical protein n=1 Tax=Actinomadura sp. NPDC048021 TaxID=3155385 RepID=UPI003400CCF3
MRRRVSLPALGAACLAGGVAGTTAGILVSVLVEALTGAGRGIDGTLAFAVSAALGHIGALQLLWFQRRISARTREAIYRAVRRAHAISTLFIVGSGIIGAVAIDTGVIDGATAAAGLVGYLTGPAIYNRIVEGRYVRVFDGG